jgi:translation initiation factor IF-3
VVGAGGEQLGVMDTQAALRMASSQDLDMVEVAPMARPPVVKLMDYSKFKYEQAIKAKEARRKQNLVALKEMKMRPKIDPHDYETKKGHVERFLKQGHKVKVTIMFRGREMAPHRARAAAGAAGHRPRRARPGRQPGPPGRAQHDHGVLAPQDPGRAQGRPTGRREGRRPHPMSPQETPCPR